MLLLEFWPEQTVCGSVLLNKRNGNKTAVQRLQQDLTITTELWQLSKIRSINQLFATSHQNFRTSHRIPLPGRSDTSGLSVVWLMAGSRHYMCKSRMTLHTSNTPLFEFYHKTARVTFKTLRQMLSCSSCQLIHHRGHCMKTKRSPWLELTSILNSFQQL